MDLPSPRSRYLDERLLAIVADMAHRFAISGEEAVGRVARVFSRLDLTDPDVEDYVGHESDEYWSNTVYYGFEARWWDSPQSDLAPEPWP
jgi:hypothetical protein